jgi:hypothetical protein
LFVVVDVSGLKVQIDFNFLDCSSLPKKSLYFLWCFFLLDFLLFMGFLFPESDDMTDGPSNFLFSVFIKVVVEVIDLV